MAVGLVIVAIVAAYVVFGPRRTPPAARPAAVAAPAATEPARSPLGAAAEPITLPPLGETDALVRELAGKLSSHPRVAAWLATGGLIRNFAYVVDNVADGKAPTRLVGPLRPSGAFGVVERGETVMDPRSGDRYTPLAEATASIDPAGAARLYTMLKPRLDEAYREVAKPDTTFDGRVERAIVLLLQTPVSDDPPRLRPKGIGYGFADPALERLTPAQKQLLRMGPRNARTIQAKLRAIALALGIPETRLP